MQVIAFKTPSYPDWRWRIVNYAGEMVEESSQTFPSIGSAVADGTRRMREVGDEDLSTRPSGYHRTTSHLRGR
ncbi:MAG: hypothetical protein ACREJG_11955 [Candidatus Rokuibacteriota bacterium]